MELVPKVLQDEGPLEDLDKVLPAQFPTCVCSLGFGLWGAGVGWEGERRWHEWGGEQKFHNLISGPVFRTPLPSRSPCLEGAHWSLPGSEQALLKSLNRCNSSAVRETNKWRGLINPFLAVWVPFALLSLPY